MTPKKLPYGLKLYLIEKTGETYHNINKVLNGTSADVNLIEKVTSLLSDYNRIQQDLATQIENAQ